MAIAAADWQARQSFAERWERMDEEERRALFGDVDSATAARAVADLSAFASRLSANPDEVEQLVAADYDHLEVLAGQIGVAEGTLTELRPQRILVALRLLLAGELKASVARRAGITPMMVTKWSEGRTPARPTVRRTRSGSR